MRRLLVALACSFVAAEARVAAVRAEVPTPVPRLLLPAAYPHGGAEPAPVLLREGARVARLDVAPGKGDGASVLVTWPPSVGDVAQPGDQLQLWCEGATGALTAVEAVGTSAVVPPLPDARCPFVLKLVRAGEVAAEAPLPPRRGLGRAPRQLHLSFTGERDEARVAYVTGSAEHAPRVRYGLAPGALDREAAGTSRTYAAADMCNSPANHSGPATFYDPGFVHRVVLTGLPTDGSRVYYSAGNPEDGWSEVRSFASRTTLRSGKWIMYADQALPIEPFAPAWRLPGFVRADLAAGYDAFLLHPGDLGYAMGSTFIWDLWGELVEPVTSVVPYMVGAGNHEYDHEGLGGHDPSGAPPGGWHPQEGVSAEVWGNMADDSKGECGVPLAARFDGTGNGNGVFWYSFEEAGVHVAMLSSEHDWRRGSTQHAWLEADLAAVDRARTPWVVVASHRMMYTTQECEKGDYDVSLGMRDHLEDLLHANKVNLMLVGHQHSYERSCAVYRGECVPDGRSGTVHLTVGSAGAVREGCGFSPALGNFSAFHTDSYGYVRVDGTPERLAVEFVATEGMDGTKPGAVADSVTVLPWTS